MRILKIIGLSLLAIVLLIAIVGLFLPSTVSLERSIVVNASAEKTFEQVNTLKNWEQWNPFLKMDPNTKVAYNNIPSGAGATYSWASEKTGEGTMLILKSTAPSSVQFQLEFKGQGLSQSEFRFSPEGTDATKVTWSFSSDIGNNPFSRVFWTFGTAMMKDAFDGGLKDLKTQAEKN
ncbi:MAG: SRPBCC family protein [Bacteroidota bacterium]